MKSATHLHLADVQNVYSAAEGRLWELLMGEQIHIGGFTSSMDLAHKGGIVAGARGVDLCCCTGAGMRVLVRFLRVAQMTGVDATPAMVALGRQRVAAEGLADKISFVEADACATGLPGGGFDFVWGEDAWCYVEDKAALIAEAARLLRPGGTMAFTDWMEGPAEWAQGEAARFLGFMKFPSLLSLGDYGALLKENGCAVKTSLDTGRFTGAMHLYLEMIGRQLTYDALKIIGFDAGLAAKLIEEMKFVRALAQAGKVMQGLIVAVKE